MIRKDYHIAATNQLHKDPQNPENIVKNELLKILDTAFLNGAVVELKILEGVELTNEGRRFSKIRLDIVSNTDFDTFKL